jgi:hypothetical protein
MRASIFLIPAVVISAGTARADTSLTIESNDLAVAVTALLEQHDEPVGLIASADAPTIGLQKGDLVRAINGRTANRMSLIEGGAILYLDVSRGSTQFVVRLAVKLDSMEVTIPRDRYKDKVDQLVRFGPDLITGMSRIFTQVNKDGLPSGVMVRRAWFGFGTLVEGDVIKNIDGVDIDTIDHAVTAFEQAKSRDHVTFTIERLDQTLVRTLKIENTLTPDPSVATPSITSPEWEAANEQRIQIVHKPVARVDVNDPTVKAKVQAKAFAELLVGDDSAARRRPGFDLRQQDTKAHDVCSNSAVLTPFERNLRGTQPR